MNVSKILHVFMHEKGEILPTWSTKGSSWLCWWTQPKFPQNLWDATEKMLIRERNGAQILKGWSPQQTMLTEGVFW